MSRGRGALFASVAALLATAACGGGTTQVALDEAEPAAAPADLCEGLAHLALAEEPMPLLGHRLRLRMPAGTEPLAPDPVRDPRPPVLLESSLVFARSDGASLTVRGMELLRRRSEEGSLAEEVGRSSEGSGDARVVEPLDGLAPGLGGVFLPPRPRDFEVHGDIGQAVVHGEDSVLMGVTFSLPRGQVAFDRIAPCTALARRIARTLALGERRLDLDGGAVTFARELSLELPPGHLAVAYEGPDFEARYVFPIAPLGAPQAQLGVYVGPDPASHVGDVLSMRRVEGALLGQAVPWLHWTSAENRQRVRHREAMVELEGAEGLWVHAFLTAPDEESEVALAAVLDTLRHHGS